MTQQRDWGGYRGIIDGARQDEDEERRRPLELCPVCGNVLDKNARGELNCNVGHWRSGEFGGVR